ncbi:hypothetical protein LJC29_01580 [Bacteroides sp. OttesenSCG-928-N06]|nr:hypothetical protein [Bacteroides sp. OttesenSCG-928-N06]
MENIEACIKKSIKKGYDLNLAFHSYFDEFTDTIREYLLTISVALELLEWNEEHKYKIFVEYPLRQFYENAFPPFSFEGNTIFNQHIVSREYKYDNSKSKEKIDIVITEEDSNSYPLIDRSLVGIELKGINQTELLIIEDIERLSKAISNVDSISNNSIVLGFVIFIRKFDKYNDIVHEHNVESYLSAEEQKWNTTFCSLNEKYPTLNFELQNFDICTHTYESRKKCFEDNCDVCEVQNATGCIYGYLIKILRKE